jgi:hypothetical protein
VLKVTKVILKVKERSDCQTSLCSVAIVACSVAVVANVQACVFAILAHRLIF